MERIVLINVISHNWDCPKYIRPRYKAAEVEEAIAPLEKRIADLEAQLKHQS